MNSNPHNPIDPRNARGPAEETLRLIASLPAPAGLEDRVHETLRAEPRRGRVLAWPAAHRATSFFQNGWMRSAAAAAIVFVVAGGGWGVYKHAEQSQPAKVIAMPAHVPGPGGLSSAGAVRAPQTIPGPAVGQPVGAIPALPKAPKRPATASAAKGQLTRSQKSAAQPSASK
ncbi:MAG: hypothetical protein ACLQG3_01770 [Terracidiphilus sp.]